MLIAKELPIMNSCHANNLSMSDPSLLQVGASGETSAFYAKSLFSALRIELIYLFCKFNENQSSSFCGMLDGEKKFIETLAIEQGR